MESQNTIINDLLNRVEKATATAQQFKSLNNQQLNFKTHPSKWSILECIEHLNRYGDFYLPEIEKQLLQATTVDGNKIYRAGWLGNYFANLMQVKDGKLKKMKSPREKNPLNSQLSSTTIDRFLKQQELLVKLLMRSRTADLKKTRTAISLTSLITLQLGDTLRFFVFHIERHLWQASNIPGESIPTASQKPAIVQQ